MMKTLKFLLAGIFAVVVLAPQPASALIDFDIGFPLSYSPKKNEKFSNGTHEDKLDSSSLFLLRGKVSLLLFSIGLGVLSGTETHKAGKGSDKYQFDTSIYELLFGLPVPILDVGFSLGGGTKDYTFKKSSLVSGSKDVNKSFAVLEYGVFAAFPIDIPGPLALRVGASYQMITGSEEKINIADAFDGGAKFEHTVNPSANLLALTLGLEF